MTPQQLCDEIFALMQQQGSASQIFMSQAPSSAPKELTDMIGALKIESLLAILDCVVNDPEGHLKSMVNMIIQVLPQGDQKGEIVHAMFVHLLEHYITGTINEDRSTELNQIMVAKLSLLQTFQIVDIIKLLVRTLEEGTDNNGMIWEIFPNLIQAIEELDSEVTCEGENTVTGRDFKVLIMKAIGVASWPPKCSIKLVIALRETNLDIANSEMVLKKSLKQLRILNPQDYPVLIHNILLFSAQNFGIIVLGGIIHHFSVLDSKVKKKKASEGNASITVSIALGDNNFSEETLLRVEGDTLWKINFAVKQNKALVVQFIKNLKTSKKSKHSPFLVATLLSLAADNKKLVIDYLKSVVIARYNDMQYRANSPWLAQILSVNATSSDLVDSLMHVVEHGSNWENALPSLVELALALIDASVPPVLNHKQLVEEKVLKTFNPAIIGRNILKKCFLTCSSVQKKIFDEIISRILTSNFTQQIKPVLGHLALFKKIIISTPHEIADKYSSKIRDMVDYLSKLQPEIAAKVIEALHPLYTYHTGLRDNVILVLRKAMFSADISSRKISVNGFLSILSWLTARKENEKLQEETLHSLRRCLTQQKEIREEVYVGLARVFKDNIHLRGTIFRILVNQFRKYYSPSHQAPIKTGLCFKKNSSTLTEPLPILLASLHRMSILGLGDSEELCELFASLTKDFLALKMEEYEMVSPTTVDFSSIEGEKLIQVANLLAQIVDVLMEHELRWKEENAIAGADSIVILLAQKRDNMASILKEMKGKNIKGKAASKFSLVKHTYHVENIIPILSIFSSKMPVQPDDEEKLPIPLCEEELNLFTSFLDSIQNMFKTFLVDIHKGERLDPSVVEIVTSTFTYCSPIFQNTYLSENGTEVNQGILRCVECSMDIIISQLSFHDLVDFFTKSQFSEANVEPEVRVSGVLQGFQDISGVVKQDKKILPLLLKTQHHLAKRIAPTQSSPHVKWLETNIIFDSVAEEFNYDIIYSATELYLSLNQMDLTCHSAISREVRFLLTECDTRIEAPCITTTYNFDIKSISKVLGILLACMNPIVQEVECAVESVKSIHKNSLVIENAVAQRMGEVSLILLNVISSKLTGSSIRVTFRLAIKFYRICTMFFQYLTSQTRKLTEHICKFVKRVGKLSEGFQTFLDFQNGRETKTSSKGEGTLNKLLIFELERFQTSTVKYSKKIQCKDELMKFFKRSTARTFRIDSEIVNALNLKRKDLPKENDGIADSDEDDPEEPPRKKQATSSDHGIDASDEEM